MLKGYPHLSGNSYSNITAVCSNSHCRLPHKCIPLPINTNHSITTDIWVAGWGLEWTVRVYNQAMCLYAQSIQPIISSAVDLHLSNMTETSSSSHLTYNVIDNFRCADQLVAATVTYKDKYNSEQQPLSPMLYWKPLLYCQINLVTFCVPSILQCY